MRLSWSKAQLDWLNSELPGVRVCVTTGTALRHQVPVPLFTESPPHGKRQRGKP